MEFETKLKIDPNRQQKVFTAEQIAVAMKKAEDVVRSETAAKAEHPLTVILTAASVGLFKKEMEVALGIDGPNGAYIDQEVKAKESMGRGV